MHIHRVSSSVILQNTCVLFWSDLCRVASICVCVWSNAIIQNQFICCIAEHRLQFECFNVRLILTSMSVILQ